MLFFYVDLHKNRAVWIERSDRMVQYDLLAVDNSYYWTVETPIVTKSTFTFHHTLCNKLISHNYENNFASFN